MSIIYWYEVCVSLSLSLSSLQILTPFQQVALAANSRKEMEEWISAFKVAASKTKQAVSVAPS